MSGLCGWIGHGSITTENRQLAERMTRPLVRFDDSKVQILVGSNSALAVAGNGDNVHLYQNKELMVALWGRAEFLDSHLAQLAHTDGIARTLAKSWLKSGEKAFAGLAHHQRSVRVPEARAAAQHPVASGNPGVGSDRERRQVEASLDRPGSPFKRR